MSNDTHDHRGNFLRFSFEGGDIDPDVLQKIDHLQREADILRTKAGMYAYAYIPSSHPAKRLYKPPYLIQWEDRDYLGFPKRITFRVVKVRTLSTEELKKELEYHPDALAYALSIRSPYEKITLLHQASLPVPYLSGYNVARINDIQGFILK